MKIKKLTIGLVWFVFIYLLVSFFAVDINFANWYMEERLFVSVIGSVGFLFLITI